MLIKPCYENNTDLQYHFLLQLVSGCYSQYSAIYHNSFLFFFFSDLSVIPCEFCGEPFIADDLVQHQVWQ